MPLPPLSMRIQPTERTLVNIATIFYASPQQTQLTVPILGYSVRLIATPEAFTWNFGDGTSQTTTSPGHPYPGADVSHAYRHSGTVRPSLTTGYRVTYSVDGGPWETMTALVLAPGSAATLAIDEARPVLVAP